MTSISKPAADAWASAVAGDDLTDLLDDLRRASPIYQGDRQLKRSAADLIEAQAAEIERLRKAISVSAMYLETGFVECGACGQDVPTVHTHAAIELCAALESAR